MKKGAQRLVLSDKLGGESQFGVFTRGIQMPKFDDVYFTMTESDVLSYVVEKAKIFSKEEQLSCEEIGDGNLNYIFRVRDAKTNRSVIIKQAGPFARISEEFEVSPERNRIEYDILKLQNELVSNLVPRVYQYDPIMNCTLMEDLSDHLILREALLQKKVYDHLAEDISDFMVGTLLMTSDLVMDHQAKKILMGTFINPELCNITEDLVYTEPFYDCDRNDMIEGTKTFVSEFIWQDEALKLEMAKAKFNFMTSTQALLHGDLHTGAIFVKEGSTKVIDPEFAFYGPIGHDVGNLMANFLFALVHAKVTKDSEKDAFSDWLKDTTRQTLDLFIEKFSDQYDWAVTEPMALVKGYKNYYIEEILRNTATSAGAELCRRIIGIAHVKDMTAIESLTLRAKAEEICLRIAKVLILEASTLKEGRDYLRVFDSVTLMVLESSL